MMTGPLAIGTAHTIDNLLSPNPQSLRHHCAVIRSDPLTLSIWDRPDKLPSISTLGNTRAAIHVHTLKPHFLTILPRYMYRHHVVTPAPDGLSGH
jgi:hypothetical protein